MYWGLLKLGIPIKGITQYVRVYVGVPLTAMFLNPEKRLSPEPTWLRKREGAPQSLDEILDAAKIYEVPLPRALGFRVGKPRGIVRTSPLLAY